MINRATSSTAPSRLPPVAPGSAATRGAPGTPLQQGGAQVAGTTTQQVSSFNAELSQVSISLHKRNLRFKALQLQSQKVLQYKLYKQLLTTLESKADLLRQSARTEGGFRQVFDSSRHDNGHALALLRIAERQALQERSFEEARKLQALRLQFDEQRAQRARSLRTRVQFSSTLADPRRRESARSLSGNGQVNLLELTRMVSERENGDGDGEQDFDAQLSDLLVETNHLVATARPRQQQDAMKNIERTSFLKQFYGSCAHVRNEMLAKNPGFEMKTSAFVKTLQQLISDGMQPKETLQLVQKIGGRQLEHQLALVNRLLALLKELKYMNWNDNKSRQKALDNLLLLSTALVNEEQRRLQEALG
ncbi:type III secretion effector delivery regulator, TyeA family [Pseudomonas flavescens]|uniref:Type III secretion effector delivery regulator, TyeA family n=1 Tax=Phytopseudomonas flavescens TaxID=29435 RepID=A0A1G8DKK0_9GAMM|nr:TyeA family type III secretion system gatekeeper subunit [Pseudomonas flavescens]SDH57900.1 type III secretion effector delivery regulator, TyeA family [Pseudomonas flavescens]